MREGWHDQPCTGIAQQVAMRGRRAICAPAASRLAAHSGVHDQGADRIATWLRGARWGAPRVLGATAHVLSLPCASPEVPWEKTKKTKSGSCRREKAPKSPTPRRAAKDKGKVGSRGAGRAGRHALTVWLTR